MLYVLISQLSYLYNFITINCMLYYMVSHVYVFTY